MVTAPLNHRRLVLDFVTDIVYLFRRHGGSEETPRAEGAPEETAAVRGGGVSLLHAKPSEYYHVCSMCLNS